MMAGKLLLSAAIAALASASSALPDPASAKSVASPDGRVTCEFALEGGLPVADVSFRGKHVFRMMPSGGFCAVAEELKRK